jgi:hypothetical protein
VGDVLLGRGVAEVAEPLADVAAWLRAADLALGNLESVIVADGTPKSAPGWRTPTDHSECAGYGRLPPHRRRF